MSRSSATVVVSSPWSPSPKSMNTVVVSSVRSSRASMDRQYARFRERRGAFFRPRRDKRLLGRRNSVHHMGQYLSRVFGSTMARQTDMRHRGAKYVSGGQDFSESSPD